MTTEVFTIGRILLENGAFHQHKIADKKHTDFNFNFSG